MNTWLLSKWFSYIWYLITVTPPLVLFLIGMLFVVTEIYTLTSIYFGHYPEHMSLEEMRIECGAGELDPEIVSRCVDGYVFSIEFANDGVFLIPGIPLSLLGGFWLYFVIRGHIRNKRELGI